MFTLYWKNTWAKNIIPLFQLVICIYLLLDKKPEVICCSFQRSDKFPEELDLILLSDLEQSLGFSSLHRFSTLAADQSEVFGECSSSPGMMYVLLLTTSGFFVLFKIFTYGSFFWLPSSKKRFQSAAVLKLRHSMILPLTCFTLGRVFCRLKVTPSFLQI